MDTRVRTMKALQAILVIVQFDKRPVRAILAREALEAVAATRLDGEEAMLAAFREHQAQIERIILARCVGSGRKSVILWGAGDVAMPGDERLSTADHEAS